VFAGYFSGVVECVLGFGEDDGCCTATMTTVCWASEFRDLFFSLIGRCGSSVEDQVGAIEGFGDLNGLIVIVDYFLLVCKGTGVPPMTLYPIRVAN
jgi:hypothetical protein